MHLHPIGETRSEITAIYLCGSGLARESARSVNSNAECAGPFMSKPTPTLDRGQPPISIFRRSHRGMV
ncbi:hypothetical protein C1894_14845 [Pseudomonas sp. FW305-3-2-15-E-TSA2]|nr:hypothetical protein C1895_04635 [Pseudomonas sp. FW305-3-2-15-E-TSA4]POA41381.1 hypothetical protein C1894_14845 [Pseudomonas sp. FW305-3-2-15-E-TSA2]